ncbi:(Fe-S)-binding protein [Desulfovibrio sp. 86]|uniref:Fe-S oxidoreductase n=1 Tax=uncultured Desulfovibrio sp. TaxID=167968 RepID=A0A212LA45_9BACT|nr:(Fe-S)-binding protein [Desulfovibrio sp. 86]SCM74357.1 Fe-S oxidoreductase [uncultured Desulfovibrio sp.]VZH34785.1 Fe-S oxidoreductase [Desulfovibrio sp. 86]
MRQSAFSIRQRMALDACTECGQCLTVCPAVAASGDADLSAQVRMHNLKKLLRDRNFFWKALNEMLGREPLATPQVLKDYGLSVFRCSLCGDCEEVCPAGLPLKDMWLSLREELSRTGDAPDKIRMIRANLDGSHNVFDEDNDERGDWVDDMRKPPKGGCLKDSAEVVYFTGCVGAYFPLAQKIPMAFVEILDAGGVDFTIMAGDEWCCGFPLQGSGQSEGLPAIIAHNVAAAKARGARKVVFTCPSCYQIWREAYPPEFELVHASEMVAQLVLEDRLPLGELPMTVTYHDPCDLGRGGRVFDEPRAIMARIPGLTLVEMEHNREHCLCCGGGGNLEMIDPDLSAAMAKRKVEEAVATGAEAIITNCQQCVRTMMTYAKRNKVSIDVMDMSQLVAKSIEAGRKALAVAEAARTAQPESAAGTQG